MTEYAEVSKLWTCLRDLGRDASAVSGSASPDRVITIGWDGEEEDEDPVERKLVNILSRPFLVVGGVYEGCTCA